MRGILKLEWVPLELADSRCSSILNGKFRFCSSNPQERLPFIRAGQILPGELDLLPVGTTGPCFFFRVYAKKS